MRVINFRLVSISIKKRLSFLTGALLAGFVLVAFVVLLTPDPVHAGSLSRICTATGNCRVCDIVATFTTLGKWLMTGAAGAALVVIVNAGVTMIVSAGNAEKIGEAKKHILWAVLGTIVTYFAFTLVSLIILFMATPSQLINQTGDTEAAKSSTLSTFLSGTAWYNICNEKDLRAFNGKATTQSDNLTANCLYWGDGTPCSTLAGKAGDPVSICYQGSCVTPSENSKIITAEDKEGKTPVTNPITGETIQFNNACDYLAQVDPLYAGYSCQTGCQQGTIEEGFCPGPTYCCRETNDTVTNQIRNTQDEATARAEFAKAFIEINRTDSCGELTYQEYERRTGKGCTSVANFPSQVLTTLKNIDNVCNGCITVTGGTELGHSSHGPGLPAVDIRWSTAAVSAIQSVGMPLLTSYQSGSGYICEDNATSKEVPCSTSNNTHIHLRIAEIFPQPPI